MSSDNERGKATGIMTLANPIGMLLGFIIQGIFAGVMYEESKGLPFDSTETAHIVRDRSVMNIERLWHAHVLRLYLLSYDCNGRRFEQY